MDKSYATPDLAKMAMYWGFDRPCSAGVTVKAPVLYAERETLDSVPEAVTDSTHTIRNDRGVLKVPDCVNTQLFKEYYDALYHGIASQFGIWRSKK